MPSFKIQRTAELLMACLARELITNDDPELSRVTLTAVDLSPDLKLARIFWSVSQVPIVTPVNAEGGASSDSTKAEDISGMVARIERTLLAIKSSMRKTISDELNLRYTPQLEFRYDRSVENGSRIEELLRQANIKN